MENIDNKVVLTGKVVTVFRLSHEIYGEKFYSLDISVARTSGYEDIIPIMISERLIDIKKSYIGEFISVVGQYRSYNRHTGDKNRLILTVFVQEYEFIEADVIGDSCNRIELCGYICKEPVYRKTPLGREIADLLVAVNRSYGKSDYIPCIVWGRNARFISGLAVGLKVKALGRIQSREYVKKVAEGKTETRVAYEVSVSKFELVEEEENEY